MKRAERLKRVHLPWSDGLLSAKLWQIDGRSVVGVPELGLHCYGQSESEAVFRLFTSLLKYYRQLKSYPDRLNERGLHHLILLKTWVEAVEKKMIAKEGLVLPLHRK